MVGVNGFIEVKPTTNNVISFSAQTRLFVDFVVNFAVLRLLFPATDKFTLQKCCHAFDIVIKT